MQLNTPSSPHFHGPATVTTMMLRVIYALIPGMLVYSWLFGWGVIINVLIAIITALLVEAVMLKIRQRPLVMHLSDGSALVTAFLLGLALPPLAPWWLVVLGIAFAIIFAKHLYGGLGFNPFNPAMVGYVMLLISFPLEMTSWPLPHSLSGINLTLSQSLGYVFSGALPSNVVDSLSMATPLDVIREGLGQKKIIGDIIGTPLFGILGGRAWEWVNLAYLLGGIWLIHKRVISWHVPVAMLGSLGLISLIFYGIDSNIYTSPIFHLSSGAAILGAFFIATDPVSGAATDKGRLWFGAGAGILIYVIRTWGGFPDAVAFAVLLMNMAAPIIDHHTKPRVFGHRK